MCIIVDGVDAVTGDYSAYITEILVGNYATLATLDYEGDDRLDAIALPNIPIDIPSWDAVTSVTVNGQILTSATDPEFPQSGEYIYNPYTNAIAVIGISGTAIVTGTPQSIPVVPPLLSPPHPWLFTSLPLQGEISINRSFEQHPSAEFEFETAIGKSFLQAALTPGLEVDIYGIPLRINSLSITELPRAIYPSGMVRVSISFGGKYENHIDGTVFLRGDGKNIQGSEAPFGDSECLSQQAASTTNQKNSTTVAVLLGKLGINYTGPQLATVPIAANTPLDATASPSQLLQERVRVASGFLFYSNPAGVEVKRIGSQQVWNYSEVDVLGEIQTSYQAIDKSSKRKLLSIEGFNPQSPDFINFPDSIIPTPIPPLRAERPTALAFEYANSELSGEFSNPKQDNSSKTQGQSKPQYVKQQPKRTERVEGDKNAQAPLEGVSFVQTMSLCFDIGGQTKTRTTVTEENGTRIQEVNEIWGFAYTAVSIYDESTKKLRGGIGETWKCLKRTTTQYIYEENTGYLVYVNEDGYNTFRFQQESADKPETLSLTDADKLSLYRFIRIPISSRTSYKLRIMPEYNSDGLFELYKSCNRDGTSSVEAIINPNYAPPYYVETERNESVSFASRPNPANKGIDPKSGRKYQPDLIVGEESRFEATIDIIPAQYQIILVSESGTTVQQRGEELQPQKYVKYTRKFKAQGQAIAEALEEVFVEESTGNPPVAQRRADLYKREQAQDSSKQTSNDISDDTYKYFLQTEGYTYSNPISGSESFSAATTLEEALTAARCKLAVENWRQGLTEQLQIPGNLIVKEGDKFNYFCNGEYRQRVILSVQHKIEILGIVNNLPRITAITSLSLGRWILPTLKYNRVKVSSNSSGGDKYSISIFQVINENLGELINWSDNRSRRNP